MYRGVADWESRHLGGGGRAVSNAVVADWESRLPGGGGRSVTSTAVTLPTEGAALAHLLSRQISIIELS